MHLLPEDQKRGKKNRTQLERAFKYINVLVIAIHFGCFLVMMSQLSIAVEKTYGGTFWFAPEMVFETVLEAKTNNCTVYSDLAFGAYDPWWQPQSNMDRAYRFAEFGAIVRYAVITNVVLLVISGINKLMFDINFFHLRYRHFILRKDIVTTFEVIFIGVVFSNMIEADAQSERLRAFIRGCGVQSEASVPFLFPMVPMYVGLSITVGVHAITMLIMMTKALKKNRDNAQIRVLEETATFSLTQVQVVDEETGAVMPAMQRTQRTTQVPIHMLHKQQEAQAKELQKMQLQRDQIALQQMQQQQAAQAATQAAAARQYNQGYGQPPPMNYQ